VSFWRPVQPNPFYRKRSRILATQLNQGDASYTMYSSDLSPGYINFNRSEYTYWKQAQGWFGVRGLI
jgi:hypothetical protein